MPPNLPPEIESSLAARPTAERIALRRIWSLLGEIEAPARTDADAALADLKRRLSPAGPRPAVRRPSRRRLGIPLAAAAAIAAVALWAWHRPVSVTAPRGELVTVNLPEGSTVHLNSGSEIRYQRRFQAWPLLADAHRAVSLEGEAFFDVVPGERPFVVTISGAEIEVLGTTFNVRSWRRGETEVAVATGRVRVKAGAHEAVLRAGGVARVDADSVLARDGIRLDQILAWRRRAFAAIDRPLASILDDVERRYALTIDVEGGLALEDSMTLLYGPETAPQSILHDICLVQGCRYRQTSRGYAIFSTP